MRSPARMYRLLLALYPRRFRDEYGEAALQLLCDRWEAERGFVARLRLLFDILRDATRPEATVHHSFLFHEIGPDRPSRAALINGAMFSLAAFLGVIAFMGTRATAHYLIGSHHPSPSHILRAQATARPVDLDSEIKMNAAPYHPPRSPYFLMILVLTALDWDEDNALSASEIDMAPERLLLLDLNHDGMLSAEECGFQAKGVIAEHPDQLARGRLMFMCDHPVLSALDLNHDGVISADEIRRASRSLRTLDENGDGVIAELELRPDPLRMEASAMVMQYDANNDGRIARDEFETTATPPRLFDFMDANHDGFVTTEELIAYFLKSQGPLRQLRAAPH
jgi:hypothetical protein